VLASQGGDLPYAMNNLIALKSMSATEMENALPKTLVYVIQNGLELVAIFLVAIKSVNAMEEETA